MKKIESFKGEYRWLSNFWPVTVWYDGVDYRSVEHAYVAAKTDSLIIRALVREAETAGKAKRLGRTFDVRPEWKDPFKIDTMRGLTWQKYRDPELRKWLLATGEAEIIEGNTWGDTFWGVCDGVGQNNLGKIIMDTRKAIAETL
jgi:ribA/ribD-fused uncharacterized protein